MSYRPGESNTNHQAGASSSHFRLDPLLQSTFGHRSIDLYGSQAGTEEGDSNDDSLRAARRSHHFGNSSLINASRYGPSRAATTPIAQDEIPEIGDEADEDDDGGYDYDLRERDNDRQWGRGINVGHFARGGSGSGSGGSGSGGSGTASSSRHLADSAATQTSSLRDDTPNASYLAAASGANRTQPPVAAHIDPFLIEDEPAGGEASAQSRMPTRSAAAASPPAPSSRASKGKGRASPRADATSPFSASTRERGWLAHSLAKQSGNIGSKSKQQQQQNQQARPSRDVYSIYDDENEDFDSSDDDGDPAQRSSLSESDQSDDEDEGVGLAQSASRIHQPAKLSASSFPRGGDGGDDDFHRRVYDDRGAHDNGTAESSQIVDTYTYPTSIGGALSSWKPWAEGNNPRWREWKDQSALVMWAGATALTVVLAGGASLGTQSPSIPKTPATRPSPYYTLTRSLPLLILLSALSLGMALVNLAFLRNLERLGGGRYLRFLLIATPSVLGLGWIWAFAGSFFYEDEKWSGGIWSTVGLRLISLFPLLCAVLFSRLLYLQKRQLGRSLSVLSLSAKILSAHPTLLALSLIQILVFLAVSIPFMTIFIRLFVIGHFTGGGGGDASSPSSSTWVTDSRARILAWLTLATWIWTWAALRGIMRVVVSSTVSHWYFHGPPSSGNQDDEEGRGTAIRQATTTTAPSGRAFNQHVDDRDGDDDDDASTASSSIVGLGPAQGEQAPGAFVADADDTAADADDEDDALAHRNPTARDIVRASFLRATGPSFGTILLSALLMALSRLLILFAFAARNLARLLSSPSVPSFLHPLAHLAYLVSGAGSIIKGVSDYTLVYAGITGQGFWKSSRRCGRILARGGVKGVMEGECEDKRDGLTKILTFTRN